MTLESDAKHILELRDEDLHRCSCGIATDQRFRQVGDHEAEVYQAQPHLLGGQGKSGEVEVTDTAKGRWGIREGYSVSQTLGWLFCTWKRPTRKLSV